MGKDLDTASREPISRPKDGAEAGPATGAVQPPTTAGPLPPFLRGGTGLGRLIADKNWSETPLGAFSNWPAGLRYSVSLILNSTHPMFVAWGPEQIFIYNDAYVQVLGLAKHPSMLGLPFRTVWAEIWHICQPYTEQVFTLAQSCFVENLRFLMSRGAGIFEETYYSFSYSPIIDDEAVVSGLFSVSTPVTGRVLSERRLQTLGTLSAKSLVEKTLDGVAQSVAATLSDNSADVPYGALYLLDRAGKQLQRSALVGLDANDPRVQSLAPAEVNLASYKEAAWFYPWQEVLEGGIEVSVALEQAPGPPALGLAGHVVKEALVLPLAAIPGEPARGVLICGTNPCRPLDDDYRSFLRLAAVQVATALNNARIYAEQRERAEALAALDRAKTLFFNNVSHELRTPLTLILGPLEELLAKVSDANLTAELRLMRRSCRRLLRLVNTLLDFSRIEAGRVQARFMRTDLAAYTRELASGFQSAMSKAGLEFAIDCPTQAVEAYIDREFWEKIVYNLLANAFKYTHRGWVRVTVGHAGKMLELSVADSGIGIPVAEQPRLFERFHRVASAVGRTHEGTGIGLALVLELVKMHGGEVKVVSEEGVGSHFTVRIPTGFHHLPSDLVVPDASNAALTPTTELTDALPWLADFSEADPEAPATEDEARPHYHADASETPPSSARILLVEDSADMRAFIERLLSPLWQVVAAKDGVEALDILRREQAPIDLVLSDVMMPRLDGFGLLAQIRANPATRTLPVILLSARAGQEARVEGLAAAADDYLVKPFSSRELKARVHGALRIAALRKQAAEAVAAAVEIFRTAIIQAPIPIMLRERGGKVIALSKEWTALSGFDLSDIPTVEDWVRLAYPPNEWADRLELARSFDNMMEPRRALESEIITKAGAKRDWALVIAPLSNDQSSDTLLMVAAMDITERKRAEQDLAEAKEAAVDANRAKSAFLANMSHEIRTPLGAILGFGDLLSDGATLPERQEYIATIKRNGEQLMRLVSDILDLAKIEAGRMQIDKEVVNLPSLLSNTVGMLKSSARDKNLALKLTLIGSLPEWICTDSLRFRQIMVNIIGNAIKFTKTGEITVEVSYQPDAKPNAFLHCTVADSGIGMQSDQIERIWEAFVQADNSTTRHFGGTGLGLSLSRQIARALGGDLVLQESKPGVGSKFAFWVEAEVPTPALLQDTHPPQGLSSHAVIAPKALGGLKILVVDDAADNRQLALRLLQRLGAAVDVAADGEDGVRQAMAGSHDLVLMDIQMPGGLDGYQAVAKLRQLGFRQPVIALTAQVMKEERQQAQEVGFDGFLTKPIVRAELIATILKATLKSPSR